MMLWEGPRTSLKTIESEIKDLHLDKKNKRTRTAILLCSFIAGLALSLLKMEWQISQMKDKLLQFGGKKFLK